MDTNKELIKEIIEGILDFKIIPFFGAGMSKPFGFKDWDELILMMKKELTTEETDNLKVAQLYENKYGRDALISKLKESYQIENIEKLNTDNHQLILAMNPPIIYTTNYDEGIELTGSMIRRPYYKIACLKDIVEMPHTANIVVKFHGDFSADQEIVLTENDFQRRMKIENPLDIIFRSHLLGKKIFFTLTQTLTYNWVTSTSLPIDGADPFDISPTSLYSVTSDKPGSPPLQTFYDWFDRKTFIETSTLSANVFKEQAYDALGHDYQSTNTYQKATISSSYGDYDPVIITKLYDDIKFRPTSIASTCASAPTLTSTITYTSVAGNTTVTTTKPDGTTSSQTTDPAGFMINSTDYLLSSPTTAYSSVNYTYLSNGHADSIILNGATVQTFAYDSYGRQTNLNDVNFGGSSGYTYAYNAYNQLYSQEDPNGDTYTMAYDVLGRPTGKVSSAEGTYTYTYVTSGDGLNQLQSQKLVNTAATYTSTISYTYDDLHRPLTMDVNGLTTTYAYDPTYGYLVNKTYPGSGFEITNIYDASNYGFLIETDQTSTSAPIWTANYMNPAGQYVDYTLGDGVHTIKSYTPYDFLTGISGGSYQSSTYDFDPTSGNLLSRTENSLSETFTYDASLNSRLATATTYTSSVQTAKITTDYDQNGNIQDKSDICAVSTTYTDVTSNNQIAQVPNSSSLIDPGQTVSYTSFNAPLNMTLNSYSLAFTYGPDNNREQTVLTDPSSNTTTRTYGNAYEKTVYSDGSPTTEVNYIQCGGDLVGMYINQSSGGDMYYVYSDHLGSILTVTDGTNTYNQSFDVWGNYRNPANGTAMGIPTNPSWLYRGFTGHEHLPQFQLINANGRLYDPLIGSMLSPDITVQSPTNTQNFNRYSYCMNNPLKYTDPSGFLYNITAQILANEAASQDGINALNSWEAGLNTEESLADQSMVIMIVGPAVADGGGNDPGGGDENTGNTDSQANVSVWNLGTNTSSTTTVQIQNGESNNYSGQQNGGLQTTVNSPEGPTQDGTPSTSDTYTVTPDANYEAASKAPGIVSFIDQTGGACTDVTLGTMPISSNGFQTQVTYNSNGTITVSIQQYVPESVNGIQGGGMKGVQIGNNAYINNNPFNDINPFNGWGPMYNAAPGAQSGGYFYNYNGTSAIPGCYDFWTPNSLQ